MREFIPADMNPRDVHKLLLSGVAPRPIALTATADEHNNINLAPFSFFNAFSGNPPVVIISPAFRGVDGSSKDTYENLKRVGKCTISMVTYSMVGQCNLASSIYPADVNEFEKAGLTMRESSTSNIPHVAESPFALECDLLNCIELAPEKKGSGNLMILQVTRIHVKENVLNGAVLDPTKVEMVSRLGQDYYARITPECLFRLPAPSGQGVGFDSLPQALQQSSVLSANTLSKLAGLESLPEQLLEANERVCSHEAQQRAEEVSQRGGSTEEILTALLK